MKFRSIRRDSRDNSYCRASIFCLIALFAVIIASTAVAAESGEQQDATDETEATATTESTSLSLGAGQGLRIESGDGDFALRGRGVFQGFYEFESDETEPAHSSFFLRLLRADIQGHAFSEDLTFRLMPEFASGQTRLLDGWISYRFLEGLQLRGG